MFWIKLKKVGNYAIRASVCSMLLVWLSWGNVNSAIAAPTAFQLGTEALRQQQYESAVQYFEQAINQGQHLDSAHSYQCVAWLMLNEPQRAQQSCEVAIAMNAQHPQVSFYHGLALYRLNQFEAAIAAFTQHLHQYPEDARAYYNYGLAEFAQGHVADAIAQYHQALTYAAGLAPVEMSNLYNDLGVAYWLSAKPDEAKFALDQAVELDEDDTRAHFNRGCICHHRGEYLAALDEFDRVLQLDSHHAETYFNRGLVNQHLGQAQAAMQDYRAALEQFQQQGEWVGAQKAKLQLHQLQHHHTVVG